MTVVTSGFPELSRAFGRINKQFPKDLRKQLKLAAEPVRVGSERLAASSIGNLGEGDPWDRMRTGGGIKIVYVAPRARGHKGKQISQRRRNANRIFADKLLVAMEASLTRNADQVARRADHALESMERDWQG